MHKEYTTIKIDMDTKSKMDYVKDISFSSFNELLDYMFPFMVTIAREKAVKDLNKFDMAYEEFKEKYQLSGIGDFEVKSLRSEVE